MARCFGDADADADAGLAEAGAGPPADGPRPAPATPAPVATPRPAPATPPSAAGVEPTGEALADAIGLPSARRCVRRGRLTVRLKAPNRTRVQSATVAINGRVKRRVDARGARKPVKLRRLPKVRITVVVKLRAANGRTYTTTRSYRNCAPKKSKRKLR